MAFPTRFLDDIRDRVALAEVVARRVQLTRRGREHSGLCPFHNEKTPSFTVSDDKGFYHCFGCGAHGSVFDFVMNTEGLSFPEAVEQLAGLAGLQMPLETPEDRAREQRRAGLAEAVEAAAIWFAGRLRRSPGKAAMDYLKGRGLDDAVITRFRLGFAPESRDGLKVALLKEDFSEDLLVEAGLLIRPEDGRPAYDRFRGRVMFPIADRKGRAVAFGGRILAGDGPKYLNSPETPLFHKGHMLYNLDRAAKAAHEGAEIIVAEGYMDVIALDRAGFHGAVAPLGTALTEDQIAALWKLAAEPVLCFDGDTAGARAAARAADRALPLLRPGKSLRFAVLPAGQDPDDLIAGGGPAAMRRLVEGARPMSDVLWDLECGAGPVDTPERRADLKRRLMSRAGRIADPSVQDYYRAAFHERLRHSFRPAWRPGGRPRQPDGAAVGGRALVSADAMWRRRQQVVLAMVMEHPVLADEFSEALGRIAFDPDLDKFMQALQKRLASNPDLDGETLKRHLTHDGFASLVEALSASDVRAFARRGDSAEDARVGLGELLERLLQDSRKNELKATARLTADNPDDEAEARFLEFRKDVERGETRMLESGDEPASRRDGR